MAPEFAAEDLFFRVKPVNAIIVLSDEKREWYASSLAKEIDCTFPHIIKILAKFNDLGLVSFKESGRKKLVFLTTSGKQLASDFVRVANALKRQSK
jgi:Mn-dependent DtxR family transcriptional regulator